jgi:hypothetical protein
MDVKVANYEQETGRMNQEFKQTCKLINKLIGFVGGWAIDNEKREARRVGGKGCSKKLERNSNEVQVKWANAHSIAKYNCNSPSALAYSRLMK